MIKSIVLKPGREKSLLRKHPWLFSGAVANVEGHPTEGETVKILSATGGFSAWGAYSPNSQIRARVWSWNEEEKIDDDFFFRRLKNAIAKRNELFNRDNTNAFRLLHAESDGIPGLIVDRYAEVIVMQCLSCGVEKWRDVFADQIMELTGASLLYERSDVKVRELEGLKLRKGVLRQKNKSSTDPISSYVNIIENGLKYRVDVQDGQKTGFYLDQRENRTIVRELAREKHVLDCFAYSGGFTINALRGGAIHATAVDVSSNALELIEKNLSCNNLSFDRVSLLEGDVFQILRKFRDQRRKFDLIILDPPKFAPTAAQKEQAARGYKDINLLSLKLINRGGYLVTFSCSGGISAEFFQKIIAGAAIDAGVSGTIMKRLFQGTDHPMTLSFPEGAYLKGFVIRV